MPRTTRNSAQNMEEPSPGKPRGRPKKTVAKGMGRTVLNRHFERLDTLLAPLKAGPQHLVLVLISYLELDAFDADLVNCWHFARLDMNTRTLADIGENAVSLVDSLPATAKERTSLRQQFSQSMLKIVLSVLIY